MELHVILKLEELKSSVVYDVTNSFVGPNSLTLNKEEQLLDVHCDFSIRTGRIYLAGDGG